MGRVTGQSSRGVGNWQSRGEEAQVGLGTSIYNRTGETALAEPLLEQLLMQSAREMQFPGTETGTFYDLFAREGDGGLFWSEFGFHTWRKESEGKGFGCVWSARLFDVLFVCYFPFVLRSVSS